MIITIVSIIITIIIILIIIAGDSQGSLRCVSKKDHVTENSSHVNKKLKFEG